MMAESCAAGTQEMSVRWRSGQTYPGGWVLGSLACRYSEGLSCYIFGQAGGYSLKPLDVDPDEQEVCTVDTVMDSWRLVMDSWRLAMDSWRPGWGTGSDCLSEAELAALGSSDLAHFAGDYQ